MSLTPTSWNIVDADIWHLGSVKDTHQTQYGPVRHLVIGVYHRCSRISRVRCLVEGAFFEEHAEGVFDTYGFSMIDLGVVCCA
jgi:hypothetical protein